MTTPSGQIKFSDIAAEFGTPPGKNLGAYRLSQSVAGRNWPLDDGVPTSGPIKFSDLRNKTLNVVVDYSGGASTNMGQTVTIDFLAYRSADKTVTATFTPQSPGAASFTINCPNNPGPHPRPRSVVVGVNYVVTSNEGSRKAWFPMDGSKRSIAQFEDGVDRDFNDLQIFCPVGGGEFYTIGNTLYYILYPTVSRVNLNSTQEYNSSGVVVGGFKSRPIPGSSDTKKVHHIIRQPIGSSYGVGGIFQTTFETRNSKTCSPSAVFLSTSGGSGNGCSVYLQRSCEREILNANSFKITDKISLFSPGSGYRPGDVLTVNWSDKNFQFTVTELTASGVSFETGPPFGFPLALGSSWGSGTQLFYTITDSGGVYGGYKNSSAFKASISCNLTVESGGDIISGPVSGSAVLRDSGVNVSIRNNGNISGPT